MKLTQVPKFSGPHGTIEFPRASDLPGFSHRVVFNGMPQKLWVANESTTGRACIITKDLAVFFMRVVYALKEGKPKYHYVDRNEDPPLP